MQSKQTTINSTKSNSFMIMLCISLDICDTNFPEGGGGSILIFTCKLSFNVLGGLDKSEVLQTDQTSWLSSSVISEFRWFPPADRWTAQIKHPVLCFNPICVLWSLWWRPSYHLWCSMLFHSIVNDIGNRKLGNKNVLF